MNLKTTLHIKTFHLRDAKDAKAYAELNERLLSLGLHQFKVGHATGAADPKGAAYRYHMHALDGREIELETNYLFDNQWNTAPIDGGNGLRVFDWQDTGIFDVPNVRTVQWLDQTEEMDQVRREHFKCGYCGAMYHLPTQVFCDRCLDSEYLEAKDLHLLRLRAIDQERDLEGRYINRPGLSEAERDELLPRFREAQIKSSTERGRARIAKARVDIEEKYAKAISDATVERDGKLWILDHIPGQASNAIYYNHTGRWSFGWRKALDEAQVSYLLHEITEFPFPYDIKCNNGKTLSGER